MATGLQFLCNFIYLIQIVYSFFMRFVFTPLNSLHERALDGAILSVVAFDVDAFKVTTVYKASLIELIMSAFGFCALPNSIDVQEYKGRNVIFDVRCGVSSFILREDVSIESDSLSKIKLPRSHILYAGLSRGAEITNWLRKTVFMTDLEANEIFTLVHLKRMISSYGLTEALLRNKGPCVTLINDITFEEEVLKNKDVLKLASST